MRKEKDMTAKKLGIIGWRGMVGSVLQDRFKTVEKEEKNWLKKYDQYFFSTSQAGQASPEGAKNANLYDAHSIESLREMDVIVTSQGGDYTKKVYSELRGSGWNGFWVDAASALRMDDEAIICLSPVNENVIKQGIDNGIKTFVGGNCTVSLLLMAIGNLINEDLVEWVSTMTYQAASGSGARHMRELVAQMGSLSKDFEQDANMNVLEWEKKLAARMHSAEFPTEFFPVPLAGGLIPWIDTPMENGQSREEWKAQVEANKILGRSGETLIPIDGTCVRVGALRCHSQAVTLKLKKSTEIQTIEELIKNTSEWTQFVPNEQEVSMQELNPAFVSGSLNIPVGRVRKMNLGDDYVNLFTCGDQLLWGAAEPLKCMLEHLADY